MSGAPLVARIESLTIMSEPQNVRLRDAQKVYRLLGECLELWDDAIAWREHLLAGMARLARGRVAVWTATGPNAERGASVACLGWDNEREVNAYDSLLERPMEVVLPGVPTYISRHLRKGFVAFRLSDVISSHDWHRSIGFNEHHRQANCDSMIVCSRSIAPSGAIESLSVSRPIGDTPFTVRDRAIIEHLHRELAMLIGTRLANDDQLGRHALSRRQRQTLDGLLAGLSENEIARRLGISPTTVHDYVGMLYRHFAVQSRYELMSYYVARRPRAPQREPENGVLIEKERVPKTR